MKKKYLAIILLFVISLHAQENKPDPVGREMLKFLKSQDIESNTVRNLWIEEANKIISKSSDTVVINNTKKYLRLLDTLKFNNEKTIKFSSLSNERLKNYSVQTDKFTGNSFITHKKNNTYSEFKIYIAISNDNAFIRVKTHYSGKDWVFMDKVILLIDGKKYSYNLKKTTREIESGGVTEDVDQIADDNLVNIIKAISETKTQIDIRLQGDSKVYDGYIKEKELLPIRETFELYNSF